MSTRAPDGEPVAGSARRVLDPIERVSEVLFGLIMVLTFTGSLSVYEAGRADVRDMLIGALGCNLAWGIVDGVMYLMGCLADKGRALAILRAVREAGDSGRARDRLAESLPPLVASVAGTAELEALRGRLAQLPEPPSGPWLTREDWLGALGVLVLVFLSTFPVVIPFMLMSDAPLALRVSNGIATVMLFLTGYGFGRCVGYRPWLVGLVMVVVGGALVAMTIALGG